MSDLPSDAANGSVPIVDVRRLTKIYRNWTLTGRKRLEALGGVDLQAYPGEVFGLLGPNGAGKTTLIKTLLGVIQPSGGRASLFGLPAGSSAARQRVGYLPESLRIDTHHTARSALRFYGRMSRMTEGEISRRTDELLELVGLRDRDQESVKRFSKGMGQRLGLAQALMHEPDLLILDEPTDGLDPVGRSEVRRILERLRDAGKTIFLNSHILQEVELVCTRVAILARGHIRGVGTVEQLSHADEERRVEFEIEIPTRETPLTGEQIRHHLGGCLIDHESESESVRPDTKIRVEPIQESNRWRIVSPFRRQAQVDRAVDALRAIPVSILEIRARRASLEETFLRLVGDNEPSDSPSSRGPQCLSAEPHVSAEVLP